MLYDTSHIGAAITAIGALGTAATGLVDGLKFPQNGGLSNLGFTNIERMVGTFLTEGADKLRKTASGEARRIHDTLHGNWINGVKLDDQKAIARSMIKLLLKPANAAQFAMATGVDRHALDAVANKMSSGSALEPAEVNALGRFDVALAALLDDAYQHADQRYRNGAKLAAMAIAVALAFAGGATYGDFTQWTDRLQALLAGLLATPLAPIAKDLASALSAGAKVAQTAKSQS